MTAQQNPATVPTSAPQATETDNAPTGPKPWERQHGETGKAYMAFVEYRDSDRNLSGVARKLGKSRQLLVGWQGKHRWSERADAWDRHRSDERVRSEIAARHAALESDIAARAALQRQRAEATTSHVTLAGQLKALASVSLNKLVGALPKSVAEFQTYVPPTSSELMGIARLVHNAIREERLALGLPTDVTHQDVTTRAVVEEAYEAQALLLRILQEHVCEECRVIVAREFRLALGRGGAYRGADHAPTV